MGKREVEGLWLIVASDVMGPFPPSKSQYRDVLDSHDWFTKSFSLFLSNSLCSYSVSSILSIQINFDLLCHFDFF